MAGKASFSSTIRGKFGNPINLIAFFVLSILVIGAVASKVIQYYAFRIHDWDTGIYSNVVWNLVTGDGFHSDVLNRHDLGEHFSPIVAIFVPGYLIAPSPLWLLAGQGLAVGATYVLLYFLAIKIFSDAKLPFTKPLALLFAVWAFFYHPLTSALLFDFHPSTLATPLLAGAILALLYRRDLVAWVLVAALLLSKENAPLAILGLACYAGLVLARPRLGLAFAVCAGASAALIMGIIMPHFRAGAPWHHYSRLGPLADWAGKSIYLFKLLAGVGFLPLASWRSLLCAVPLVALNLSVNVASQYSTNYHYDDFASVFLFVAAVHGCVGVLGFIDTTFNGWRALAAYAAGVLLAAASSYPQALNAYSYFFRTRPGVQERQLFHELAEYRRPTAKFGIAAQQAIGPYLSFRQRYVGFSPDTQSTDIGRLKPGDKILITPIREPWEFTRLKRKFDHAKGLVKMHVSPVLQVYQVERNAD
jgi:uncharacterized membrane protein